MQDSRKLGIIAMILISTCRFAHAQKTNEYDAIKSIGVISRIGDTLTIQKTGSTVFGNSQAELQIDDWNIDEATAKFVTDALTPWFAIKSPDARSLKTTPDIKSFVQSLPAENRADAYVIIGKNDVTDPTNFTNVQLSGLGIYRHNFIIAGSINTVFAFYTVSVMDAKTGKIIDYGTSRLSDGGIFDRDPAEAANDPANWEEKAESLTDTQKQAIKTKMLDLIQHSMPYALKAANLISALPAN